MDEQFKNLLTFGISIVLEIENLLIFEFSKFQKFSIQKIQKISNLENSKNCYDWLIWEMIKFLIFCNLKN